MTLNFDLSTLKPHQREALLALIQSFFEPYCIPESEVFDSEHIN